MNTRALLYVLCAGWMIISCTRGLDSTETDATYLGRETPTEKSRGEAGQDTVSYMKGASPSTHAFIEPLDDLSDELSLIFPTWKSAEEALLMDGVKERMPDSYETMYFRVVPERYHDAFGIDSEGEGYLSYLQFQEEKCHRITEIVSSAIEQGKRGGYPRYTYAGIRERARIYADVPLFGREAGELLNDKFAVTSYSSLTWIGVSYPDFDILANGYEEELPTDFDEVFQAGTALFSYISDGFVFSFKKCPEEQHQTITFTIEIPIEGEYFQLMFNGKDYPETYYTSEQRVIRNENRVLRGSVTVRFDK